MTRASRYLALITLAAIALVSCGRIGGSTFNARPADVYAVMPSMTDVRAVLGDNNWWEGPPSFQVSPLDSATAPLNVQYAVSQLYLHIGTAEELLVRYTVYDKTSSATSVMTEYSNAFGPSPSNPKVGDQVLYYGVPMSGAAPVATRTFVRVGQIIVTIVWSRKDSLPTVQQLGKVASKFVSGLKNVGKTRAAPSPVAATMLPPPNLQITYLGSAQLPVESLVVLTLVSIPDQVVALLRQLGVVTFAYGDYALNNDTHMEVQTALISFASATDATSWAGDFSPGTPDSNGIASGYVPIGGTPAAGVYHYVFTSGSYGVLMVCKASIDGEAASRECEDPMGTTAFAWKLALAGLR
ncbi:MAG TPA: hypothetical protein VF956_05200 [Candidatus Dormibacteraeota bacterium]